MMDDEDSQLLVDDSNFEEIFVKCEPSSPGADFELIGNEKLSQPPPAKRLKIFETCSADKNLSSHETDKTTTAVGEDNSHDDVAHSYKKKKKKHVTLDPFEREIMKILEANQSQLDYSVRDPDAMFFISHVPVMKQFSPKVKLDFQVKFMQLLQSYSLHSVRDAMMNPFDGTIKCNDIDDSPSNDCVT